MTHADPFQTLADPTRRRIVASLQDGELPVNAIVTAVQIQQSGVSRHLRILHEAGFVQSRAQGQQRLYSLCPAPFLELDAWVAQYRSLWEARLDRLGGELQRRQAVKSTANEETNR